MCHTAAGQALYRRIAETLPFSSGIYYGEISDEQAKSIEKLLEQLTRFGLDRSTLERQP